MADNDYVIRARITADPSSFQSEIKGAVAANKSAWDQMQADFAAASANYKQKLTELTKQQDAYAKANIALNDPAVVQVLGALSNAAQSARDQVTVLAAKMVGLNINTEEASKGFQLTDAQLKSIARSAELAGRQLITLADIERTAAKEGTTLADLKVLENQAKQEVALARSQQRSAQTTLGPATNVSPIASAGLAQSNAELTRAEAVLGTVILKQAELAEAEAAAARPAEALAEAEALVTRQSETLASIQATLSGAISETAAQINSQYIVANKEAAIATNAFIKASTELGAAVKAGSAEAIQAVNLLRANYQQLLGIVEELAAREELMVRAEAQATEATVAESRAQANAAIQKEGSAVAALKLANAERELATAAEKQAAAIISANNSVSRSEVALSNLQAEVAAKVGVSAAEMVAFVKRAEAEVQNATSNLKSNQIVLGASQTAESKEAIAGLTSSLLQAQQVLTDFSQKLATLKAQSSDQSAAAATFSSATDKEAEAIANVSAATTQLEQRFNAMKALIVETAGADLPTLDAALVRVRTDLREAQTAFQQAQSALSILGNTSTEASAQLAATQATWIAMTAAGNDFIASVGAAKDAQEAENAVIAATADANAQAIAAVEQRGEIEKELASESAASSEKIQEYALRAAKIAQEAAKTHAQASKIITDAYKSAGIGIRAATEEGSAALLKLDAASKAAASVSVETAAYAKLLQAAEKAAAEGAIEDTRAEVDRQVALHGSAVAALEAAGAERVHADALGNVGTRAAIARGGINELVGSGQGVVFAFSRMVAASKVLGPLLEAAFPVIGAIAFIDILGSVGTKIGEVIDAMHGMDKFGKEMFELQEDLALKTGDFYVDLADKVKRISAIGLGGTVKVGVELAADEEKLRNIQQQYDEATLKVKEFNEARQKQAVIDIAKTAGAKPIEQGIPPEVAGGAQAIEFIKGLIGKIEAPRSLDEINKKIVEFTKRQQDLQDAKDTLLKAIEPERRAESASIVFQQRIKLQEEEIERTRRAAEIVSEIHRKSAQEDLTDKKVTDDDATRHFIDAENERFTAVKNALEAEDALKKRQAARGLITYDPSAKNKEEEVLELQHQENLTAIQIGAARRRQEELKRIHEQELKDLETRVTTAAANAPEGEEKRTELKALQDELQKVRDTSVSIGSIGIPDNLKEYEYLIKRIPIVTKEASKEAEKEVKETTDQIFENWVESGNRSAEEIIFFWNSVRSFALPSSELFKEATAKITEETKKLREEHEKLIKVLEEEKEIQQTGALEQQKVEIQRQYIVKPQVSINPIALTPEQKEAQEIGKIELQEIDVRRQTLARELADEEAANKKGTAEYQKTLNEKEKLDQQYELKRKQLENKALQDQLNNIRQYVQQVNTVVLNGFNEWIFGQKKFGQAMVDTWNNIVRVIVQDIEKIAAKWIEEHIIMAAISKLLGIDDSSAAATAKIVAQNTIIEQSNAGRASTDVFVQAIESIPFPYNLAAAPVLANVAYTEAETAAHLDTGGYIPREGMAHLHQGEVVVNHPVTEMLSNIAERGNAYYDQPPQAVAPNANPSVFQPVSSQSSVGVSNNLSSAVSSLSNKGGDVHVHYSPTIHGGGSSTPDLKKLLSDHADHIGRIVSRQSKAFNR